MKKTIAAHHGCVQEHHAVLKQAAAEQATDPQQTADRASATHAESRSRVVRARHCYEQVQALKAEGTNITTITRELRLAPGTARRYYHAKDAGEVTAALLTRWPSPQGCRAGPGRAVGRAGGTDRGGRGGPGRVPGPRRAGRGAAGQGRRRPAG